MVQLSNVRSISDRAERRYRARRLEILSAAARTFRNRGFANTGMREIAAAADLSPANLYHYFKGKHELLYFCQDRSVEAMLQALNSARRSRLSKADKLRRVLEAHLRCVLDEVQGSAAHLETDDLPPELRQRLISKRDRYEQGICRLVASGMKAGEFVACDPRLVTKAILGSLNWTARWYNPDGTRTVAEIAGEFSNYLVRGLLASPDGVLGAGNI